MSENLPVLIVGAGPVGLTAGLVLADHGVRVRIFEAEKDLPEDPRASTFHPPTLELFERFDITARLIAQGQICPDWQIRWHPSGERAVFDLSVLQDETPHPYRLQCEQWKLAREVLAQLSASPQAEVVLGAEVTALEQSGQEVEITLQREGREEQATGAYVIGADGARSLVRKAIGVSLEGDTYPETVLIAETAFPFPAHLEGLSYSTYCWRDGGNFSMLGLAEDRWRVGIYPLDGMSVEEQLSESNIEASLQAIVRRDEPYHVITKRAYRAHNRIAPRYRSGRVFLAGDAAHLNSPTGGMGLNGGLHDAFNLADKLAAVIQGRAPEELLDAYQRQRRPIAQAEILSQADRNRARMREKDPAKRRAIMDDLQAITRDRDRLKAHVMKSSMIEGLRRAASIA
ncbi:MAG: FAD-dependent monooxygenase [Proteobacteria bacterium]|nr:FAD-dependent monooxygenase [Pseudomonadota bacterium]